MQHFSKYLVQILVIRSKCQGWTMDTDDPGGRGGAKKFHGGRCLLLSAPLWINIMF